ncbi:Cysteine-rich receptor-like protein kinase 8 [Dichanthelium oligosanthes]|uniref:Cysteine-rich receptor-like protein kinase 8 n=1 Tax=Dichanthelium oligosanthes TaxID=888268 RepID=A0A1E5W3Q7_9POAL|nr:Cysteine-rich receptor-like protein kinase 8 [Dichanthelium oligosanthes]
MATDASRGGTPSLLSTLPKELPLDFLKEITDGFSPERKLGKGAFGTVYKGILQNGEMIAVKKLADNSPVAPEKQFQNEVVNLMAVQHENIVKLVGYCHQAQKKVIEHNGRYILVDVVESLLCYEYAPNGNLDKCIFDTSSRPDWKTCFNIIKGICQGLHFLHKEMDKPIVHLDLQPANILLDDNMVPKISDFGLSRLFGEEQTRINTINVVGAKGYMAPEYLYRGEISTRSDIYSLGVLIMEITTGEKNFSSEKDMSARDFVRQTWTDEHIASKYSSLDAGSLQEVKTCIDIGLKCVDIDQRKRTSIVEIVDKLNGRHAP